MTYSDKVLIAIDQLCNAILDGYPDETLSARAWRWHRSGKRSWAYKLIDRIFFWQGAHCHSAYMSEMMRKQCPREYRND